MDGLDSIAHLLECEVRVACAARHDKLEEHSAAPNVRFTLDEGAESWRICLEMLDGDRRLASATDDVALTRHASRSALIAAAGTRPRATA